MRLEQAHANRSRIVAAARALFVEQGYLATTIADIAARAGVSVPTVYKSFASKGALAEQAYTEPGDEDLAQVLTESQPHRALSRYAAVTRQGFERAGAIAAAIHAGAAAGEPELQALAATRERERARATGRVARHVAATGGLRSGVSIEQARDVLWYLVAPETHLLLVERRGWSYARLERWLAEAMTATLL